MRSVAYQIRTERLVIRCWSPSDAPLLKKTVDENLPHLQEWLPWAANEPTPLDGIVERLRRFRARFDLDEEYYYGIFTMDESEVIGGTGLHRRVGECALETGYWIASSHIGRGLATEAAAAMTRVGFELHKVQRMEIRNDPGNVRSAAVPERLGYTCDGVLRHDSRSSGGQPRDTTVWGLTADDYPNSRAMQFVISPRCVRGHPLAIV